jgi:hypothetical protein
VRNAIPKRSLWVLWRALPGAISGSGLPPCWGGARAAVKTMASGDLGVPRLDGMTVPAREGLYLPGPCAAHRGCRKMPAGSASRDPVRWTGGARF